MFIVAAIILFSLEIENLINLYRMKMIGNPPYTPKINTFHVVITGNPSFSQLMSILRELFHEDHQDTIHAMWSSSSSTTTTTYSFGTNRHLQLHAVILGERKSKFTKKLIQKIEADPIFAARVTFVAGNALRFEDLERTKILDAYAAFVFPDKLAGDATKEDAKNIMRVLSIKRHVKKLNFSFRILVMVLKAESTRHMLAAGIHRDDIICENIIKMGTLAQSSMIHGASTMLSNLASCLSIHTSIQNHPHAHEQQQQQQQQQQEIEEEIEQQQQQQEEIDQNEFVITMEETNMSHQSLLLQQEEKNHQTIKDQFKNSKEMTQQQQQQQQEQQLPLLEQPHEEEKEVASSTKSWIKEYYKGAAKEMYYITLSKVKKSRFNISFPSFFFFL
jgi:hypothetical protein